MSYVRATQTWLGVDFSLLNPTMTYHAEKCRFTNRCELFVELYLLQVRNLNIYCPSPTEIFWKWHQSTMHQHWEIIWKILYSAVLPVRLGFNKIIRISLGLLHSKWQSKLIDDIFVSFVPKTLLMFTVHIALSFYHLVMCSLPCLL